MFCGIITIGEACYDAWDLFGALAPIWGTARCTSRSPLAQSRAVSATTTHIGRRSVSRRGNPCICQFSAARFLPRTFGHHFQ